jgi:hypothetical protein
MSPLFPGIEEVLEIHHDQILQSALAAPQAGAGPQYFHADLFEMAGWADADGLGSTKGRSAGIRTEMSG